MSAVEQAPLSEAEAQSLTNRIRRALREFGELSLEKARLEGMARRPRTIPPAHVYFIQADNGLIKIGCASDPRQRLADLQTGSPVRLRLLGVAHHVGQEMECRLHERFAADRVRGEWFRPSPELLSRIAVETDEAAS